MDEKPMTTKPQKIEGGKTKPLTEERVREIVREEITKIPPTYAPIPYPQPYPQPNPTPATPYQPYYPRPWDPIFPQYTITCQLGNLSNIK